MKNITLLGSTGSIGVNTLAIVRKFPEQYRIVGLAAGGNIQLLSQQVLEFEPQLVSVIDEKRADGLADLLPRYLHDRIVWGNEGNQLVAAMAIADFTLSAIVGSAGLLPTLAAIRAGKTVGLANKETLVMAGRIVMDAVRDAQVTMLPVDSEHSAIFQALESGRMEDVHRIILTASGGPFRQRSRSELDTVTPAEALAHPNWSMGKKISIDSATLMNKGLEVIEARWLFNMPAENIEVLVHPQSIVHSLVEFHDGSVLAQLGIPDMRIPIAYALSYPERLSLQLNRLDLCECGNLTFEKPDFERFPALQLAFDALNRGGVCPAVLNAANEVAVAAFLENRIAFQQIAGLVKMALNGVSAGDENKLSDVLGADHEARHYIGKIIDQQI